MSCGPGKLPGPHELPLSIRCGGHDWAGRAVIANGVLINLRRMNGVQVDAEEKTTTVQGGITSIELIRVVEPLHLVAVTRAVGDVGLTGLTLGGGYGPLSPSLGLAIDNLLSTELVLADGTVCTASPDENSELF